MANYPKPENNIDPEYFIDHVLWCVYDQCFATMFPCVIKLSKLDNSPTIWGYSIYKRQPGFRTLGQSLTAFYKSYSNACFFQTKEDALVYMSELNTPDPRIHTEKMRVL